MGRPTDSPKLYDVKVRLDEGTLQVLMDYCAKTGKKKAESIRDGINRLKDDPEKK